MHFKKVGIGLTVVLFILITSFLGFQSFKGSKAAQRQWPTIRIASVANSADLDAIKSTMKLSYHLKEETQHTFDYSRYTSVFVDDPSVTLPADKLDFIASVQSKNSDKLRELSGQGWLTFKVAQAIDFQKGAQAIEQLQTKAATLKQPLNPKEVSSITASVNVPVARDVSRKYYDTGITYKEIKIDEDGRKAEVTYDDGAALASAFFVKTQDGWKIAAVQAINVHF